MSGAHQTGRPLLICSGRSRIGGSWVIVSTRHFPDSRRRRISRGNHVLRPLCFQFHTCGSPGGAWACDADDRIKLLLWFSLREAAAWLNR